jgi:uncharacterized membrane protein required for colicin V production
MNKALSVLICVMLAASISYSRILLGVHSLNQVLFGTILGIWFACTFHFVVRKKIVEYVNSISNKTSTNSVVVIYVCVIALICVVYENTIAQVD